MKDFFGLIEFLFVDILFAPLDFLRSLELKSWLLANGINFVFIIIISGLLVYWMFELVGLISLVMKIKTPLLIRFYKSNPISFL